MLGAIIGDTIGSIFEWHNIKSTEFPFLTEQCRYTDDSVLTCAVADCIMNGGYPPNVFRKWVMDHPKGGYGGMFREWVGFSQSVSLLYWIELHK
jgi:ADP-ribosylglycohydrolase